MLKRTLFFCVLLAVCAAGIWAAGRKDNISRSADDPSGFTDTMDTSEHKPGKYNFYLEATDKAGNIMRAGPDNIWIDPESDLPRAKIINPVPNMRIRGNLNIVGSAIDDDGVDYVELMITRGKDGKGEVMAHVRAEGAEYWSYFLDTTDVSIWTDGVYTITAWAVDINGLSGISERFKPKAHKKHQVYWHLDRYKPETKVLSHEIGALVAGKIRMRGNVADGNGIDSFAYSVDGGHRYIPIKTKYDKRNNIYNWDLDINTKTLKDGPQVIWFQARDGQGTIGKAAHLLFVNNSGPDVQIVYPEPHAVVNGIFSIAGYALHPVGLKSVTWKMGKETGSFPLLIGNHWWSTDLDIRGVKTGNVEIEIRAEDVSGNVTIKKQKYKVDQNADLPVITLQQPAAGAVIENGTIHVKGFARDNDGVSSVFYSLDSAPAVEIPCAGFFQFLIENVQAGSHVLDVWAVDVTGVTGHKVQVKGLVVPSAAPEPRLTMVTGGSGKTAVVKEFYTGMTIIPEPKLTAEFTVRAESLASASIRFGDFPAAVVKPSQGKDGVFRANVPIPVNMPEGLATITLRAADKMGRETIWEENVFFGSNKPYDFFQWIKPVYNDEGWIVFASGNEVLTGFGANTFTAAELEGQGADRLRANLDGHGRVQLTVTGEGSFGPLALKLTDDSYNSYNSQQFYILADFSAPLVTILETPRNEGAWVQNDVPVKFNITGSRIRAVEWSQDLGDTWMPLLATADVAAFGARANATVDRVLNISALEDGSVTILIRAVNESEASSFAHFTVQKDTSPPQARLIMPVTDARVNGTIRIGFEIKEAGKLKSVVYKRPAKEDLREITREVYPSFEWIKDYSPLFLEVQMDALEMPLDENMVFTFEDNAGNKSEVSYWDFVIDNEMDLPVVEISLPLEDEVITTDFIVSGICYDDDEVERIYFRIDDNPEQMIECKYGFSIPVYLSTMTDNEHSVTIYAQDIYGVKGEPVTRNFRISLAEPTAKIAYPLFDTVLREVVEITGTAFDANGIEGLEISLDNGNTFNAAFGQEEWSYKFNTKILKDGPHVIFLRVWDNYEISAMYSSLINVDNTAPEILLDSPGDGSATTGAVSVMGRVIDPNLDDTKIEFRSLEGKTVPDYLRSRTVDASAFLKEQFDLSVMNDGHYNMEIVATDKAGNITRVSRNIELARESMQNFVEIYYPLDNENVQGNFNLYGFTGGTDMAGTVTIRINGADREIAEVFDSGYYRFSLNEEYFYPGVNTIMIHSSFGGDALVQSAVRNIVYKPDGPWVTIDNMEMGDFAFERPWLQGRSGYTLSEEDMEIAADKKGDKEEKAAIKNKVYSYTELSFDNGRTFVKTGGSITKSVDWRYRLETGDMTEGMHYILVRSTMKNGEVAVTRTMVQVDKTSPVIRLIAPEAGERYNTAITYTASATDDVELAGLTYHLRKGDKSAYEVPGFIQGLYFETTIPPFIKQVANEAPMLFAGGVTYMDVGMGLSFFEDNVKIQVSYGFMTQDIFDEMGGTGPVRYGGHVLGLKLLANIYALPFGSFMGPDFEWLSASFALGANFSLFDLAQEGYTQSGESTWMSALIMQVEFPKVTIPKRKSLRTFSLFTEGQIWFVPTDVPASLHDISIIIPHVIMGVRLYIF
ncbi:MAG: Ig-like domain repeat protein [Treponema sp.]|jgi:hypothetical protein|nr:Ig-like domain repeat protein [Treponema sp.]